MTRKEILSKAAECVAGEREQDYGSPENNFDTIAAFWTTYLVRRNNKAITITSEDVANMMILLKISREVSGHSKDDNWVDVAGYAACGGEIAARERAYSD